MYGLVTSWRVDQADRRRWIIELHQGVKFDDGPPLMPMLPSGILMLF
jgi:ABC-type transport system substrate-binding protein